MPISKRIIGAAAVFVLAMAALVVVYMYVDYYRVDMSSIEHIEQMQASNFTFNDLAGDIGVSSIDDIGYIVEGKYQLDIYYGKQRIKMNQACFKSQEFKDALARIGIVVKTHKNDDGTVLYKVTCWDEEVTEYSKIK